MTTATGGVAVGVFDDHQKAEKAVEELSKAGFRADQIGVAVRQTGPDEKGLLTDEKKGETAEITGVVTGGVLGGLLGAGALATGLIPGIGPVVAAGLLAAIVTGATAGAIAGGFTGALIGLGVSADEARYYHSEFEAGRTIVTVKADGRYDEAITILRRNGASGKGSPLI